MSANDDNPMFPRYDPDTILEVLYGILDRGFTWRNELAAEIAEPDFGKTPSTYQDSADEDNMYTHAYRDAACSHAAAGALSPFFEGMFRHEFASLRVAFGNRSPTNKCHRWNLSPDDFWLPHVVSNKGKVHGNPDIARGVKQLFKSLDLDQHFPSKIHRLLNALFTFRNYAMHNGYEWPVTDRNKFQAVTRERRWDSWFNWGMWGEEPWIVSFTDAFVEGCRGTAQESIQGFRKIRSDWGGFPDAL